MSKDFTNQSDKVIIKPLDMELSFSIKQYMEHLEYMYKLAKSLPSISGVPKNRM